MWANHHEIFGFIAHSNRTLVLLNLLLLLCIGFIPFPTALLAEYLGHEGKRTAVVVYAGVMMASAFSFNALWNYPRRAGLLDPNADPVGIANIARAFRMGPLLYTIAFALAFFTTWPTLVLLGLLGLTISSHQVGSVRPGQVANRGRDRAILSGMKYRPGPTGRLVIGAAHARPAHFRFLI